MPTHLKRVNLFLQSAIQCFARMRAPVVVAVNGPGPRVRDELGVRRRYRPFQRVRTFQAGLLASRLNPSASSTYYLPRIIGLRRTMELALTNRTFTAREAEAIGLVMRVVPDDQMIAQVESMAH